MQLMVGIALGVSGRKILPRKTNLIISGANAMGMLVAALVGGNLGSFAPGIASAGQPPNSLEFCCRHACHDTQETFSWPLAFCGDVLSSEPAPFSLNPTIITPQHLPFSSSSSASRRSWHTGTANLEARWPMRPLIAPGSWPCQCRSTIWRRVWQEACQGFPH